MTKIYSKLLAFATVSLLLFSLACNDDNSTGLDDDASKTSRPRADNNTLLAAEQNIPQTVFSIYRDQFAHDISINVKESENSTTGFALMISHPLPSENSGEMDIVKKTYDHLTT